MAQPKAIFIGRDHPDNGLSDYRKLANLNKVRLVEYIGVPDAAKHLKDCDYAFVSRYLAILEALLVGVPVIAHFNNQIKHDYLAMAPFAKYIKIFNDYSKVDLNFNKKLIKEGKAWAQKQTWSKMADLYEELWTK